MKASESARDESGEAMVCTGCGTTKTVEHIRATHPTAFTCCPERKMIPVRTAITQAEARGRDAALREVIALLDLCCDPCNVCHEAVAALIPGEPA